MAAILPQPRCDNETCLYSCIFLFQQEYSSSVVSQFIMFDQVVDQTFLSTSGAHFTYNFSIIIQIWWKFYFALMQILMNWSLPFLHMTQQLCCHAMCKIWWWYQCQKWNYSEVNFPSNSSRDGKFVSEMVPCVGLFTYIEFHALKPEQIWRLKAEDMSWCVFSEAKI